ncbi:right-handed parallel beta-helix repeat-containing protein [Flavilitoribacter nigricans]|uniref:Fibronectin type-III domain-containing protein n=1 Tax=Flavilitoribacter nigricans (strain ATCC 23147 / DSM 23189 / NBRC 102662 / NCIMB 1420 / SS-2) TaxID=1122177 RepID=A0A2D0N1S8_FLAN2|nr:right-handed parallel beta-helix repeat-containing protein [Flavilitoribacter nigricans]PHN02338.1 hypothetical protein CRP01_32350 [Flavilitoribacter nigricans DSM 23189 = NBRC 102662]
MKRVTQVYPQPALGHRPARQLLRTTWLFLLLIAGYREISAASSSPPTLFNDTLIVSPYQSCYEPLDNVHVEWTVPQGPYLLYLCNEETDNCLIAGAYGGSGVYQTGIPTTFRGISYFKLVDKEGRVIYSHIFWVSEDCTQAPNPLCSLVVTNTNDTGPGSLRAAIECSNTLPGPDLIRFDIPGNGPHVIFPASDLPLLTDRVVVDATTQPGYTPGSILIDGSAGGISGLQIRASGTEVYGLHIRNFPSSGFEMLDVSDCILGSTDKPNFSTGNFYGLFLGRGVDAYSNTISGNYFGVDPQEHAEPNRYGIIIFGSSDNEFRGNTIAHNSHGVFYNGGGNTGNVFSDNHFFCNAAAFTRTEEQTEPPVVTGISPETITGSSIPLARIEVFRQFASDCSQWCQGRDLLGATTADAKGNWSLSAPFPFSLQAGTVITTTATDDVQGTSPFSDCATVVTAPPGCATLHYPKNEQTGVPVNVTLSWTVAGEPASAFQLSLGSTPGGTDIIDKLELGNVYSLPLTGLPHNTRIYVTLLARNLQGTASACMEQYFTTVEDPAGGCPDLQLSDLTVERIDGQNILFSVLLRDIGTGAYPAPDNLLPFEVTYYTSDDADIEAGNHVDGPWPVLEGRLSVGTALVLQKIVTFGHPDDRYLTVRVDSADGVMECDDTNNVVQVFLPSLPGVDNGPTPLQELQMKVFPNPFTVAAEIRYELPKTTRVDIGIWDLYGRRVASPVREMRQEAGYYNLRLSSGDLPAGIYFAVIRAAGERQIVRMEIIK